MPGAQRSSGNFYLRDTVGDAMSIWQGLGKKAKEVHALHFTIRSSPRGLRDVIWGAGLGSPHGEPSCHGSVTDICFFHGSRECGF